MISWWFIWSVCGLFSGLYICSFHNKRGPALAALEDTLSPRGFVLYLFLIIVICVVLAPLALIVSPVANQLASVDSKEFSGISNNPFPKIWQLTTNRWTVI